VATDDWDKIATEGPPLNVANRAHDPNSDARSLRFDAAKADLLNPSHGDTHLEPDAAAAAPSETTRGAAMSISAIVVRR